MVSACSAWPGGDQEKPSTGRSHTRSSPTPRLTVQLLHSLKTSPAAALPSAARSTSTRSPATGSSTCWTSGGESGDGTCSGACARSSVCHGMFDGINTNTPYRRKRSAPRAETRGRRSMLSPADMTRLSEHIMRGDRRAVPQRGHGLVLEWLDAEELDVQPGYEWVRRLLHGMRLSFEKPAKCLKELHSPVLQEAANTHWLFTKLCWLMDKHAVSEDRVVNVDETSCRSDRVGPPRRQTSSAAGQHKGGHDIHGRLQHGPWPAGHAGATCPLSLFCVSCPGSQTVTRRSLFFFSMPQKGVDTR